ncbi:MAG: flagellar motor stator protein MotA [Ignavibacteriae bacterium]|nr:flagellar motor stator protein MotA [Ignavibacteriota bacterium]
MFVIIGIVLVFGSIVLGYTMHQGNLLILLQWNEFIIIGGAAIGSMLIANPLPITMSVLKGIMGTLKGSKITKNTYIELLQMMYELFQFAKREGLIALEPHIEIPESSSIFSKYPSFLTNHHAVDFLCDTLKVVLSGGVPANDLEELMDIDLETLHTAELQAPNALTTVSDAFPGLGIVAAVLGVIITMGIIDQAPEIIGHSVAAALVGTFFGILMSYGLVGPLAKNMEHTVNGEGRYLNSIKAALLAFAKGTPAAVSIEYARRSIDPGERPSFKETEEATKKR